LLADRSLTLMRSSARRLDPEIGDRIVKRMDRLG